MKKIIFMLMLSLPLTINATSYSYAITFTNNLNEPVSLSCEQHSDVGNSKKVKVGHEKSFILKGNETIEKFFVDHGAYLECTPTIVSTKKKLKILKTIIFEPNNVLIVDKVINE